MSTSTRSLRTKPIATASPVKVAPSKTGPRKSAAAAASSSKSVAAPSKAAHPVVKLEPKLAEYCTCKGGDDGSAMVECAECANWYHFRCVRLDERDAEELSVYVCSACTIKTGRRSVMEWEGPDAVEENTTTLPTKTPRQATLLKEDEEEDVPEPIIHSDLASEDEYVVEKKTRLRTTRAGKRPVRRLELSSDSEDSEPITRRRRSTTGTTTSSTSTKPKPSTGALKRKPPPNSTAPPSKRKKSEHDATSDPARKYCLDKLQSLTTQIFLHYPHVNGELKTVDELTEEERLGVIDGARAFGAQLEQSVYDIYAENGVGGKYKEEFRMLTFNLSQNDRVTLHTRIASSHLTPDALARMSSTELANEEMQQSIMETQKAALAHSILTKSDTPRKKITHKGLEDIETENNHAAPVVETVRGEEEERREMERLSRSRAPSLPGIQRSASMSTSVPPESPVGQGQRPTWGAPPPLPAPYGHHHQESDFTMTEPELNLADLINIDEDAQDGGAIRVSSAFPVASSSSPLVESTSLSPSIAPPANLPTSNEPTGISPFAVKPDMMARPSFDLSSLWGSSLNSNSNGVAQKDEEHVVSGPAQSPSPPARDSFMDGDSGGAKGAGAANDDDDFDMFLEQEPEPPAVDPLVAFERLPRVWSGILDMPLDSSIPRETRVSARQVGGRRLPPDSPLWKTLFPVDTMRIEGRVPVENSNKFLLQTRLSVVKELIAVACAPGEEKSEGGFKHLYEFLISKGRHGLVFPWGNRPKDHHPGREMYIIPLPAGDPLPDYMDMLDNLELPKVRATDLFIGIWVLTKGKLAPPPSSEVVKPTPAPVPVAAPTLPVSAPMSDAALAAEVAALTPEQVQAMLRTLTGVVGPPPSAPPPTTGPTPLPVPRGLPVPLGVPAMINGNGPRGPPPSSSRPYPPSGVHANSPAPPFGGPPRPPFHNGSPPQLQTGPHHVGSTPPQFHGATPPHHYPGATPPQYPGATPPQFQPGPGPGPPPFNQYNTATPPPRFAPPPPHHQPQGPPAFQPGPHYRPPPSQFEPRPQWGGAPPPRGPSYGGEPHYPPYEQEHQGPPPPMHNGSYDQWGGGRGGPPDQGQIRGRGGRGRGGGNEPPQGPVDQGWGRRASGNRGGGGGPPQQQWGGQQQQQPW